MGKLVAILKVKNRESRGKRRKESEEREQQKEETEIENARIEKWNVAAFTRPPKGRVRFVEYGAFLFFSCFVLFSYREIDETIGPYNLSISRFARIII